MDELLYELHLSSAIRNLDCINKIKCFTRCLSTVLKDNRDDYFSYFTEESRIRLASFDNEIESKWMESVSGIYTVITSRCENAEAMLKGVAEFSLVTHQGWDSLQTQIKLCINTNKIIELQGIIIDDLRKKANNLFNSKRWPGTVLSSYADSVTCMLHIGFLKDIAVSLAIEEGVYEEDLKNLKRAAEKVAATPKEDLVNTYRKTLSKICSGSDENIKNALINKELLSIAEEYPCMSDEAVRLIRMVQAMQRSCGHHGCA